MKHFVSRLFQKRLFYFSFISILRTCETKFRNKSKSGEAVLSAELICQSKLQKLTTQSSKT